MDGGAKRVNHSLQRNLNRWILTATALFALVASAVSGVIAFYNAREMQDNLLQQFASLIVSQTNMAEIPNADGDPEDTFVIQRIGHAGPNSLPIASDETDGLHTIKVNGVGWRVLVYTKKSADDHPEDRFAVSQQTAARDEIAWNNSLNTLLPVLLLAPILMAIARFAVSHGLKPVRELATVADQRDESSLKSLPDDDVPEEIKPFIASINHLLSRLQLLITQQQRFVADAAHELRTPLTALSLLVDNLAGAETLNETRERLLPILEGLERMRTLVSQLLDLARLQGEGSAMPQAVNVQQIVQDVIADLYPLAEAKSIDMGMTRNEPLSVFDISGSLRILAHNAVDNAIRYSPQGAKVDISLFAEQGQAVLQVEDSGSGIPEKELTQVFEPFYRIGVNSEPGSGLGLAICQEIAHRLKGTITLANRKEGGLLFRYSQPLANSAQVSETVLPH